MIYLDNAATSFPKPTDTYDAMVKFMAEFGGNPGRSGHRLATGAEGMMIEARNAISKFFGLKSPEHCVFTLNCTDALNMGIKGILRQGDHAISSVVEHNSVNRPLQKLHEDGTIQLDRVGIVESGSWTVADVVNAITPQTKLVAITHCSNVTGVLCPVEELGKALRENHSDVLFLVDAAQSAGLAPIDMEAWGIDLLAFPGHKGLYGPPGTGALLVGPRIDLNKLGAWREGGTGGDSASPLQPLEMPHYLEGGTPNTMGVAGLLAGLRFLQKEGPDKILAHERALQKQLLDAFGEDERFTIYGTQDVNFKAGVLSITMKDQDTAEVATILDQAFEICVRPGLHCSPYAHKALGTFPTGTLRLSPGYFNTSEEMDVVIGALQEIIG